MVGLFADDVEVDLVNAVFAETENVDDDRHAVRDFLIELEQNFFAHDFGDHKAFALVRNDVLLKDFLSLGHGRYEKFFQTLDVLPLSRGYGKHVEIDPRFGKPRHIEGNVFPGHDIGFRIGHGHGNPQRLVFAYQGKVLLAHALMPVQHVQNKIHRLRAFLRRVHHHVRQGVFRPIDARRIHKHDLVVFLGQNAEDSVPRGLGFG